jgi:hypothetical protein
MFIRRFSVLLSLFAVVLVPVSADMISLMVAETGIASSYKRTESSDFWESGLMGIFFDNGLIVSNAPVMRLEGDEVYQQTGGIPQEIKPIMDDALLGGASYFVLILLNYQGKIESGNIKPGQASLRLFKLNPLGLVSEDKYQVKTNIPVREELSAIRKAGLAVISHLNGR